MDVIGWRIVGRGGTGRQPESTDHCLKTCAAQITHAMPDVI
jgi:hypothetical protein